MTWKIISENDLCESVGMEPMVETHGLDLDVVYSDEDASTALNHVEMDGWELRHVIGGNRSRTYYFWRSDDAKQSRLKW